jgi:hypothetical protein
LKSVADVVVALEVTFNAVRVGKLDARVGNCLGVLAGIQLKALGLSDHEERLAALEAQLAGRVR